MSKIADTLVGLGLLSSEYDTANREPSELTAFNQVDNAQKLEIVVAAEQVIINGINSVRETPLNSHPDYPKAA
ncbi:hypothetical protein BH09PAT4_BH09PAT4_01300 [soil metagenome]